MERRKILGIGLSTFAIVVGEDFPPKSNRF